MNEPPNISVPQNHQAEQVLPILADPTIAQVQANDPEGDILSFVWSYPGMNSLPEVSEFRTEAGDWVSVLYLPASQVSSGDVIKCVVTDQSLDRNGVTIVWVAEVL